MYPGLSIWTVHSLHHFFSRNYQFILQLLVYTEPLSNLIILWSVNRIRTFSLVYVLRKILSRRGTGDNLFSSDLDCLFAYLFAGPWRKNGFALNRTLSYLLSRIQLFISWFRLLLNHCFEKLRSTRVAVIHCNAQTSPLHVIQKLSQTCMVITTNTGRVYKPKECEKLILYFKDLNLPKPDKWGTSQLVAFLQQVVIKSQLLATQNYA